VYSGKLTCYTFVGRQSTMTKTLLFYFFKEMIEEERQGNRKPTVMFRQKKPSEPPFF